MNWKTILFTAFSAVLCSAAPLEWDAAVMRGELENGLQYYIRNNPKPEGRLELRLVVNAGSVLEADDQRGLAHYVEHMAFNGTRRFARRQLVDYLESIGMRFGPELNAFTSFDETIYMLQLPVDDPEVIDKGLLILREWADAVAFEDEEIEKERGVILEERRLHRGAQQRIRDQHIPFIFQGSKYAERIPIGTEEVLTHFDFKRLRAFYQQWYRPDLMAIVAVGDVDAELLALMIRNHFSSMSNPADAPVREVVAIPDHEETLVSIVTDPEATLASASIYYKMEEAAFSTEAHFRSHLEQQTFLHMMNQRLDEARKLPGSPFLQAYVYRAPLARGKELFGLGTIVKEGAYLRGLAAGLEEIERVQRFGFTVSEWERQKASALRMMAHQVAGKEKIPSSVYAGKYVSAFLTNQPVISIENEWELAQRTFSEMSLREINTLAQAWIRDENRVVLLDGPEHPDQTPPDKDAVRAVLDARGNQALQPYVDDEDEAPLVDPIPTPGRIVKREHREDLDLDIWTLSNGARVILKATTCKDDQVLVSAFSRGGHSLIPDAYFVPAMSAAMVIDECGLGSFSRIQLRKKLAGKAVQLDGYINEHGEGMQGACAPSDLDVLFQLIHLNFTSPRQDVDAFLSLQERMRAMLKDRLRSPQAVFADMVQRTMSQGHMRREPWTPERVGQMQLLPSIVTYKDRFADADDFTFLFVGRVDSSEIESLVCTYLASLPSIPSQEQWVDRGIKHAPGKIDKVLTMGIEPKSEVLRMYTGPLTWQYDDRFALQSMLAALELRLRDLLREDLGGTYGVSVRPIMRHYPVSESTVQISFSCAPGQVDTLLAALDREILHMQKGPLAATYVENVKENQRRERETARETNTFWLRILEYYEWHGEDPGIVLEFEKYVEGLNAEGMMQVARQVFSTPNVATFVLMPESGVDLKK
jgi:zinc protease